MTKEDAARLVMEKLYDIAQGTGQTPRVNLRTIAESKGIRNMNLLVRAVQHMANKGWIEEPQFSPKGAIQSRLTSEGFEAMKEQEV